MRFGSKIKEFLSISAAKLLNQTKPNQTKKTEMENKWEKIKASEYQLKVTEFQKEIPEKWQGGIHQQNNSRLLLETEGYNFLEWKDCKKSKVWTLLGLGSVHACGKYAPNCIFILFPTETITGGWIHKATSLMSLVASTALN